jgi:hypothetical protein
MSASKKSFRFGPIFALLPLLFLILIALSGQPAYAQTGSVSGNITAYTGGAAIPSVTVQIYNTSWNYVKSATTDALGNYTITNLTPGSYYLHTLNVFGYIDQYYPGSFYFDARMYARPILVLSGSTTAGINFSLKSGAGRIAGKVTYSYGSALSGATVFVYYKESYHLLAASATTDASGNYFIQGLAPHDYYVQTSNTSGYIDKYYNNVTSSEDPTIVQVVQGQLKNNINVALGSSAGSISGTVRTDPGGVAIPGVVIEVFNNQNFMKSVTTDASGNYLVKGLNPGTHYLRTVNNSGYADEYYSNAADQSAATGVDVYLSSTTSGINFNLSAGGSISGMVWSDYNGMFLGDIIVMLSNDEGDVWKFGLTDSGGNYSITGLPPGTYYPRTLNFSGYNDKYFGGIDLSNPATPVTVTQSVNTPDIHFGLALGGSISGSVVMDPGGAGIPGVEVSVYDLLWHQVSTATTDSLGNYRIINLVAGASYYLGTHNVSGYIDEYYFNTTSQNTATSVSVNPGADTSGVNFDLPLAPYPQVITVDAITDTSPSTWTGTNYKICTNTSCSTYESASAPLQTNPWGGSVKRYFFAPGSYVISAASGAAATASSGFVYWQWQLQIFVEGEGKGYQIAGASSVASPQQALQYARGVSTILDIHVPSFVWFWIGDPVGSDNQGSLTATVSLTGSISGRVSQDSDGTGISGVTINAAQPINFSSFSNAFNLFNAVTDTDGNYTITAPAGYYYVCTMFGGSYIRKCYDTAIPNPVAVPVVQTQNTPDINFSLALGGSISGNVVRDSDGGNVSSASYTVFDSNWNALAYGSTNSAGYYQATGLPPGNYYIQMIASGLAKEYYGNTASRSAAVPVIVAQFADTGGINFSLGATGSISGRVRRLSNGSGLMFASVRAIDSNWNSVASAYSTDASGNYTITGLTPGRYYVATSSVSSGTDSYFADHIYNNTLNGYAAVSVAVTGGATTSGIDFNLGVSGKSISGRITRASDGAGIGNVQVIVYDSDGYIIKSAASLPNGNYSITGLAPGRYSIGTKQTNRYADTFHNPVDLGTSDIFNIDFSLENGLSIYGSILRASNGDPINGARVDAYDNAWNYVASGYSDRMGSYSIEGLSAGNYYLKTYNSLGYVDQYFYKAGSQYGAVLVNVFTDQIASFSLAAAATEPFGQMHVGEWMEFQMQDSAFPVNNIWTARMEVIATETFNGKTYFHVQLTNYENNGVVTGIYIRMEADKMYRYNGSGEDIVLQIGPVGTAWSYQLSDGSVRQYRIVSIGSVSTPYGSYPTAYSILSYTEDAYGNRFPAVYDYVVPGIGVVGGLDFSTSNAPARHVLTKLHVAKLFLWRNIATGEISSWRMDGVNHTGSDSIPSETDKNKRIAGIADFNRDGKKDILWRNNSTGEIYVWYMNGTAVTGTDQLPTVADLNWTIVGVYDFNYDGKPDILWRNVSTGENYIWYMNGTAVTGAGVLPSEMDQNRKIVAVGFNSYGEADILWRNISTGEIHVWFMSGITVTGVGTLPAVSDQDWKIVGTSDLNDDGKPDILWRNASTGEDYVWYMNGTTVTGGALFEQVADANWLLFDVGDIIPQSSGADFNNDGKPDILWRSTSTGENYIWSMNGATVTGGVALPTVVDQNWKIVGIADLNSDSKPDILWRNISTGENYIWYLNGAAVTSSGSLPAVPDQNWQIAGIADFSNDGKPDVLWRNIATGENYVWYMNGATVTGAGVLPTVADLSWKIAGVADFNSDGKPDILWRNTSSGENYVWYLNGAVVTGGGVLPTVADLSWEIVGVADFNSDGKPDILWRNTSSGENYVWSMNGTTVTGGSALPTVPDQTWAIAPQEY